jgi:hypothetical protein
VSKVRAVVAGPYDLRAFDELQEVTRGRFRHFVGAADQARARRLLAALGNRATARLEPEGNHSCNNLATVVRPAVADRVTDRLGSAHA